MTDCKYVERSFADAKQLRGHRYARMRGLRKVQEQSLLCAWTANIKKIALILTKGSGSTPYLLLTRSMTFLKLFVFSWFRLTLTLQRA